MKFRRYIMTKEQIHEDARNLIPGEKAGDEKDAL